MVKRYQILEHKTDLKIKVFGQDKKEIFTHSAYALAEQLNKKAVQDKKPGRKFQVIKIKAVDLESLLVDFLNELIYLTDVYHQVYPKVKILNLTNDELEAEIYGLAVDKYDLEIKAATYYKLEIHKVENGYTADIVFDI